MNILPSQKNELFELIIRHNFVPDTEIQIYDSDYDRFELHYRNKPYYIKFRFEQPYLIRKFVEYSPSIDKPLDNITIDNNWKNYLLIIDRWFIYLNKELAQPDKWGDYTKLKNSIAMPASEWDNNKFDYAEVKQIKEQLNLLKEQIRQLGLPSDKENVININIDYLSIKVETSSKIDWKNLVVGAFISTFVQLALNQETINQIWNLVKPLLSDIPLIK